MGHFHLWRRGFWTPLQGLPEEAYLKQITKDGSETIEIEFEKGEIVAVNGKKFADKVAAIQEIESIAAHVYRGRDMHVGDTIIGIKGRVGWRPPLLCSSSPLTSSLRSSPSANGSSTGRIRFPNWYGMFLHESQYLEPVMRDIEAMLESSQRNVTGKVTMELRPVVVLDRRCGFPLRPCQDQVR